MIGTWGHTSDKKKRKHGKCTQLEPSNLFVETIERRKKVNKKALVNE